jgi:NAD-dependent SIR2 family protein deacetylase
MVLNRKMFMARFIPAMQNDSAALFVGAGLSRPAGFVDWKQLMRQCAEAVGLDVHREQDLVAVAQYYLNQNLMSRAGINQIVVDELLKPARLTPNHTIIARLPISVVWTTNFDTVLEDAYRGAGRLFDVKTTDSQLSFTARGREVVIYKMHGDVARPDEVIICKEDYERYATKHKVFQDKLEGDLVSRNFLFLGFSFADPNLQYMLSYLRSLLGVNQRGSRNRCVNEVRRKPVFSLDRHELH